MKFCFPWCFSLKGPDVEKDARENISLKEVLFILILNWVVVTSSLLPEPDPWPERQLSSPTPSQMVPGLRVLSCHPGRVNWTFE